MKNFNETHDTQQDSYNKKDKTITLGQHLKKLKLSYTAGRNVKWYSCFGQQYGNPRG